MYTDVNGIKTADPRLVPAARAAEALHKRFGLDT